jgi:hypothetical protein
MNFFRTLAAIATITVAVCACNKTDDTPFTDIKTVITAKPGKYVIYQLDSIVTENFGSRFVTKSYLVKDSVIESFYDNQNRLSYRVQHYEYNNATRSWKNINTFYLTPTASSLEYVENNIRYIKLTNPVSENRSWYGNVNAVVSPFYATTNFATWQYFYKDINQPFTVGNTTYSKTFTVVQYDSTENKPFVPNNYATYDRGYEVYADSVGMVYRDIMSWEYQVFTTISNCKLIKPKVPGPGLDTVAIDCNNPISKCDSINNANPTRDITKARVNCDTSRNTYSYTGYGVKQRLVSHN